MYRPYHATADASSIEDLEAEMRRVIQFVQETVVSPIDDRLPGQPFSADMQDFPSTPMALIIGNHSCGKSTFINGLVGRPVQHTGVAPTDDGFTILERARPPPTGRALGGPGSAPSASSDDIVEDGPTVLGCPENRSFRQLQRFGDVFLGHMRRKRVVLTDDAPMPYGLQIVDSPGMIDTPGRPNGFRGRGYNFIEVVRWWARRADVVLIMFDPDKPGTTGESLDVLTRSLADLEYKFRIVLNKVDQLDSTVDFARAYGTLGWALSKVIQRKDIPWIYTICNEGFDDHAARRGPSKGRTLPLDGLSENRRQVVEEVFRAKERHYDNGVTQLERTLREVEMVATILRELRRRAVRRFLVSLTVAIGVVGVPWSYVWGSTGPARVVMSLAPCLGVAQFFRRQFRRWQSQEQNLDEVFREEFAQHFIHDEGEDLLARWVQVKPRILTMLKVTRNWELLPAVPRWKTDRITEALRTDVWYLRQLARANRLRIHAPSAPVDAVVGSPTANDHDSAEDLDA